MSPNGRERNHTYFEASIAAPFENSPPSLLIPNSGARTKPKRRKVDAKRYVLYLEALKSLPTANNKM